MPGTTAVRPPPPDMPRERPPWLVALDGLCTPCADAEFYGVRKRHAGTTDLTIKLALSASVNVLGVAGADANVISTQTGAANAYGAPLIDISVLGDYDDLCPSWGPVDGCQCLAHLGHVPHPAEL